MSEDTPDVEIHEKGNRPLPLHRQVDRGRAMLTRTDRELLLNLKEYDSEQARRNARHRLREHIRESLPDIFLIGTHLEPDELKQLVDRQRKLDEEENYAPISLTSGVFKFGCQLADAVAADDQRQTFEEKVEGDLATVLPSVVERANDDIVVTDVNVDISIETKEDTDALIDELISGNPRMTTVMSYLQRHDADLLRERLREQDTVIDLAGKEKIGPDHELFELITGEQSDSS